MNCSEFDRLFFLEDEVINAGGNESAVAVELRIRQWLGRDRKLNPGCKYLGLGAGAAIPELALAKSFHIPDDRVTLVEKQPLPDTLEQLQAAHSTIRFHYGEGLYHFLETTPEKYDLVTAFLLEKLFNDPNV